LRISSGEKAPSRRLIDQAAFGFPAKEEALHSCDVSYYDRKTV
jgi:hypothetical protein